MSFKDECERLGWWFRTKPQGTTITHTLMNGSGVLIVPLQQRERFYEMCMKCLVNREKLFMVEQTKSSDRFRMFLDIDYVTSGEQGAVTDETIKRWATQLYTAFPTLGSVLVSTCTRKQGDDFKNGIHFSWPSVTVTSTSALNILNRVTAVLVDYDPDVPWKTVLDKSVFKTGLRTIWSYKVKRDTKELVEPYVPRFEIGKDGFKDITKDTPTAKLLQYFSILPHGTESEHFGNSETIISGTNADDELLNWLKEMYPQHKIPGIDKILPKKTHWVISVRSKYCEFIKGVHQHNHGWFLIDKATKTIISKCHDEDHKNLSGRKYMVHPSIIKYLQKLENKV
jgi:hypothetical protein